MGKLKAGMQIFPSPDRRSVAQKKTIAALEFPVQTPSLNHGFLEVPAKEIQSTKRARWLRILLAEPEASQHVQPQRVGPETSA